LKCSWRIARRNLPAVLGTCTKTKSLVTSMVSA
jgi:hypothetical protein